MHRQSVLFLIANFLAFQATAWTAPREQKKLTFPSTDDMKKFAGAAAAASILGVTSMLASPVNAASPDLFTGSYADPNHPSCARLVAVEGDKVLVSGDDGISGPACIGGDGRPWQLVGSVVSQKEIFVDFSPKVSEEKNSCSI